MDKKGFTLIEFLLSALLFTIVMAVFYRSLSGPIAIWQRGEKEAKTYQRGSIFLHKISGEIRSIPSETVIPYTAAESVAPLQLVALSGEEKEEGRSEISFLSLCRDLSGKRFLSKVEYRLIPDEEETFYLQKRIQNVLGEEREENSLLSEVKSLTFRYFDGEEWQNSWDSNEDSLPSLIRISIVCQIKERVEPVFLDTMVNLPL